MKPILPEYMELYERSLNKYLQADYSVSTSHHYADLSTTSFMHKDEARAKLMASQVILETQETA